MADYPINIWVITEQEFESFTFTGGKVIYIAESVEPRYATHPAIITAGALLPPMEAIQAELDDRIFEAYTMYEYYLQHEEADPFISILIAAAIKQIPVGIMFGRDESNMQFPKMLIDFVYRYYGLVLGIIGEIQPYIVEEMLPFDLAKLYNMNIIDYPTFMEKHPPLPIHPSAISKLVYEVNPVVVSKDLQHYVEYFEMIRKSIYNNGRKFLMDPLVAL